MMSHGEKFKRFMRARCYLLVTADGKHCKVGWAVDPEARRRALQSGNPHHLNLVASFRAWRPDERMLHLRLNHLRTGTGGREWYRFTPEVVQEFREGEDAQVDESLVDQLLDDTVLFVAA